MRIDALTRAPGGSLPPMHIPTSLQEAVSEAHTLNKAAKEALNKDSSPFQRAWISHFNQSIFQAEDDPKCRPTPFKAHIETLKALASHYDQLATLLDQGNSFAAEQLLQHEVEPLTSSLPPPAAPRLSSPA